MSSAIYTSTQQRSFRRILPDLIANRGLLRDIVWKDLRARYRNAMMGFLWAVLQPVMMMRSNSLMRLGEALKRLSHGVKGRIGANESCMRRG